MQTVQRPNHLRRGLVSEGRCQAAVGERNARCKSRTILTVRYCALAGFWLILLRVSVARVVGGAVLDDLAISADMNMRISENRRQYAERQREPGEIEIPAYH